MAGIVLGGFARTIRGSVTAASKAGTHPPFWYSGHGDSGTYHKGVKPPGVAGTQWTYNYKTEYWGNRYSKARHSKG